MILIFQRTLAHYRLGIFKEINKVTGAILCFGKSGLQNNFLLRVSPDFKHYQIRDYYPMARIDTFFQDVLTPLIKFKGINPVSKSPMATAPILSGTSNGVKPYTTKNK